MPALILLLLFLSGCSVYLAAEHKSDPGIERDGWDMGCAGGKLRREGLTAKAGYCKDVRGGGMAEARIEYEWRIGE